MILYKLFGNEGKLWSMTHFYHPNFFFNVSSHLSRVAKGTKRFFGFDMISSSLLSFVWDGLSFISFWRGSRYFSICITFFSYSSSPAAVGGVLFTAPRDVDEKLAAWLLLLLAGEWGLKMLLGCCCTWLGGPLGIGMEGGWDCMVWLWLWPPRCILGFKPGTLRPGILCIGPRIAMLGLTAPLSNWSLVRWRMQ